MEDILFYAKQMVENGRRVWGLDEQWDIQIKMTPTPLAEEDGSSTDIGISFAHWPSKRATIEISTTYPNDAIELWKDILHELGHLWTAYLWRGATDYLDNIPETKKGTVARAIIEEAWNTNENFVIDGLLFQVILKKDHKTDGGRGS